MGIGGIIGKMLGTAGGEAAKGVLSGVGDLATKIRGAITGELPPDLKFKLEELAIHADNLKTTGQMEINLVEARSGKIFVAGWRPFIGWVCGLALGWNFLVQPMVIWWMKINMPLTALPPAMDLTQLYPLVLSLLGLGVYRTYEKVQGAQSNH
jgi:hypothetical protein